MQIFYQNSIIHLKTIANTLIELKQKIADEIPELKYREFILIQQTYSDSFKLVEEDIYKDIVANIKQEIYFYCFSIIKFFDYKQFYSRILEAINQMKDKQMKQSQNQCQGMIKYQQENSLIKQSTIETLIEEEKIKDFKSSYSNSTFQSQNTSQLKPKKQNNKVQSTTVDEYSESVLNERDQLFSRNFNNSTIFLDSEIKCYRCNIFIKAKSISLICHHTYHQECFQELLQQQLEQKKQEIQCICNKKIPKIQYHLESMGPYFKQKYFDNQLEVFKWKYQQYINSCTKCKQFFILNIYKKNIKSYCQQCEQLEDFN